MSVRLGKPDSFFPSFDRKGGHPGTTHYCPGCGHGVVQKLLAEAIDLFDIQDRSILVVPIGCAVFMYYYFHLSAVCAAHGRAPAVATAISRAHPDAITISYQGDGDLAAIGTSHIIHAANRGENMIVLFVNNNVYGMTGGQLAPTSLLGQKTVTTPTGRSLQNDGAPLRMAEIIAGLNAPVLVARSAVHSPNAVMETRRLLHRAIEVQRNRQGFAFLEILAPCPTNWHKSPLDACKWIEEEVTKVFPLGVLKDDVAHKEPVERHRRTVSFEQALRELGLAGKEENRAESNGPEPVENTKAASPIMKIKVAGFGGQGVLSLGLAIAQLAMNKGKEVSWLPSYGPEMRGGVANCSVVLADDKIGSPLVEQPDILIAMNKPSLIHFGPLVSSTGIILYNKTLVDDVPLEITAKTFPIDATTLATLAGNIKTANTVFLAFLSKLTGLFTREELVQYVEELFDSPSIRNQNIAAINAGMNDTANGDCKQKSG